MAAATEDPDWSSLPEDLLVLVMQPLEIPDLFSAGSVCSSWRSACSAVRRVRIPITDASPCLLYSCADDDPATATVYSPSSGVVFKVRLPDPTFRSRHVVGSAHGWVVAADEMSNLQAFNPLTGAQVDLPPVTGLYHIESFSDEQGAPMYNHYYEQLNQRRPYAYRPQKLRLFLYHRVFLSCSPSAGSRCIALLLHRPDGQLSFARVGDDRWTRIQDVECRLWNNSIRNATYNKNDGLFYIVHSDGSILTLDLDGPTPVKRKVFPKAAPLDDHTKYVILTPQGDILQLWRYIFDRIVAVSVVPPELAHEVSNPYYEIYTDFMELYKVDIDEHKLTEMKTNHLVKIILNIKAERVGGLLGVAMSTQLFGSVCRRGVGRASLPLCSSVPAVGCGCCWPTSTALFRRWGVDVHPGAPHSQCSDANWVVELHPKKFITIAKMKRGRQTAIRPHQ